MTQNNNNPHKLSLLEEDNPQYHKLVNDHNKMMDSWNRINKNLHAVKVPRIFPFSYKKEMKSIYNDLSALQKDFIVWNNEAFTFILHPNLVIPHSPDSDITFLHYMGFLRDLRAKFEGNMILIVNNYNRVGDTYSTKINFTIAIISFIITLMGLIATLMTIK